MIKKIINCLKENPLVSDWLINEITTLSSQVFYVRQKLETTRSVNTLEYAVTVYHQYSANGQEYLGSSKFVVNHKISKKELQEKIAAAVHAASFVRNKKYALVKGEKRRIWKAKKETYEPFELMDKIAGIFFEQTDNKKKFNSLEIFCDVTTDHILNSQGANYKKTLSKVKVEAIPSYDGEGQKVELYKFFTYKDIDFEKIRSDAATALQDVLLRSQAQTPIDLLKKVDIILRDDDAAEFFGALIGDYSYASVYRQNTDKKIGDPIQKEPHGDLLSISLIPDSDPFDRDGVLLKPAKIVAEGKLVSYYGDNQYGSYLGVQPTGLLRTLKVKAGKKNVENFSTKPYLEIIALSGIQIEMYNNYIGGEVRLAVYCDGKQRLPLSGFSFSGNIDNCLNQLLLSREKAVLDQYQGPKYVMLRDMDIL
jgi:predicted Zn-dependent protease